MTKNELLAAAAVGDFIRQFRLLPQFAGMAEGQDEAIVDFLMSVDLLWEQLTKLYNDIRENGPRPIEEE